ncbi:MAG: mechanosensitive ion channel [Flavobacteriales bacterium]|nr:mechanosensitive ion channel [Flavobacteriales bacterium]
MTEVEIQIIETAILAAIVIGIKLISRNSVNRLLNKMDFDLKRKQISHRIINLFLTIFVVTVLAGIWNIHRDQLIVFMTSVVTVLGIAFFAQWSILSNITSSLILFFNHPMKIGQRIRVVDKEYDISGELIDISFFFLYIKSEDGELITIPNTIVLQKTIVTKI